MSTAREEVLRRVRTALAAAPAAPTSPPEDAADASNGRSTPLGGVDRRLDAPDGLLARFVERTEDYRATVTVTDNVPDAVAAICVRHAVATLAVPGGLDPTWIPARIEVVHVDAVGPAEVRALDGVDGVLTTCALGVAETGTIALDGGPGQGPRAASLLPDLHVCVVDERAIVADVAALTAALGAAVRDHGRPLTLISGPSATSDIELDRVEGVHGPRRLEVIVSTAR